jgi:hypothetical protein
MPTLESIAVRSVMLATRFSRTHKSSIPLVPFASTRRYSDRMHKDSRVLLAYEVRKAVHAFAVRGIAEAMPEYQGAGGRCQIGAGGNRGWSGRRCDCAERELGRHGSDGREEKECRQHE